MKNSIICVVILVFSHLFASSNLYGNQDNSPSGKKSGPSLNVGCSSDLMNLTQTWVQEFSRLNPDVNINLVNDESSNDLRIMSAAELNSSANERSWHMIIGKRVIVPIMNTQNHAYLALTKQGLTPDDIRNILVTGQPQVQLAGQAFPMHIYLPDNADVLNILSGYAKSSSVDLKATIVSTEAEMIAAIQNDATGIGFCSINEAANPGLDGLKGNIALIPIDKNSNGRLDNFEKIYSDLDAFMRGVWIGKYPNKLSEPIYAASNQQPEELEVSFLSWILSDGQAALKDNGFILLTSKESKTGLQSIAGNTGEEVLAENQKSSSLPLIIIGIIVVGIIAGGVIRYILWTRNTSKNTDIQLTIGLNENTIEAPKGIFFDKSHTWAFMEQDGTVKVGVDDFLQHLTGPLTKIKMKEKGEVVRKGEKFMTIMRNGKQLDLYSPVSGVITEQNSILESNTRLINISPYKEGWVYRMEPKNWKREIEFLTMGSNYKEWLNTEFSRLRDFFAVAVKSNDSAYNHIVLQDGGELADNILSELDPKVWEDFQTQFIDISK